MKIGLKKSGTNEYNQAKRSGGRGKYSREMDPAKDSTGNAKEGFILYSKETLRKYKSSRNLEEGEKRTPDSLVRKKDSQEQRVKKNIEREEFTTKKEKRREDGLFKTAGGAH